MNDIGAQQARAQLLAEGVAFVAPDTPVRPRLSRFVIAGLPVIVHYAADWVHAATRPPSLVWNLSGILVFSFLLCPIALIAMAVMWARFSPPSLGQGVVAASLTAATAYIVLQSFGFWFWLLG